MALNHKRKAAVAESENLKAHQNKVGKEVALKKRNKEDASDLLSQMSEIAKSKRFGEVGRRSGSWTKRFAYDDTE